MIDLTNQTKLNLGGIHHLTAVTANVKQNRKFYTETLGLRLVKKTVNQDDVSAYHLFYADGKGTPGTDITFFDWPAAPERRGTGSVVRTGFRVADRDSLLFWEDRLDRSGFETMPIAPINGADSIDFEDGEGQRLRISVDPTTSDSTPWVNSPVPSASQLLGLGAITMSVPDLAGTADVLTHVLNMKKSGEYVGRATDGSARDVTFHVFEMGEEGGASKELHVAVEPFLGRTRHGAGGVHHVAFRVPDEEQYLRWADRLVTLGMHSSGPVDRFYFKSLYFREPGGVLFELATDGPGFASDESLDTLGEKLALPPFLEARRSQIEAGLKSI